MSFPADAPYGTNDTEVQTEAADAASAETGGQEAGIPTTALAAQTAEAAAADAEGLRILTVGAGEEGANVAPVQRGWRV